MLIIGVGYKKLQYKFLISKNLFKVKPLRQNVNDLKSNKLDNLEIWFGKMKHFLKFSKVVTIPILLIEFGCLTF